MLDGISGVVSPRSKSLLEYSPVYHRVLSQNKLITDIFDLVLCKCALLHEILVYLHPYLLILKQLSQANKAGL